MITRIAIFDDSPQRRDGLRVLIESNPEYVVCGMFNDCRDVLKNVADTKPDVVLMDLDMPYVNGIEGILLIRKDYPKLPVLVQTVYEDDERVFAAICAGADGYILKQVNPLSIIDSIRDVLTGGAPMTPLIAKKVLQLMKKPVAKVSNTDFNLTKRELEILEFLVKGYSYKMISEECFISYATVNSHINNIYAKLHVNSATSAVSFAIREGIIKH